MFHGRKEYVIQNSPLDSDVINKGKFCAIFSVVGRNILL
jgi:hypothetical protein